MENNINPFDETLDKTVLFNITTEKAASTETADFLLNADVHGESLRNEFINSCAENPDRFHEKLSTVKVKNFASDGKKVKIKSKNAVCETTITRDFFGRCLFFALENDIDMAQVLSFPNINQPLSLCHLDGTLMSTQKHKLLDYLEGKVVTVNPSLPGAVIIDAMFFLRLLFELPATFGLVAKRIFKQICQFAGDEIHFVSDQYRYPSIKHSERQARGDDDAPYHISGPGQPRPMDWKNKLKNSKQLSLNFFVTLGKMKK